VEGEGSCGVGWEENGEESDWSVEEGERDMGSGEGGDGVGRGCCGEGGCQIGV